MLGEYPLLNDHFGWLLGWGRYHLPGCMFLRVTKTVQKKDPVFVIHLLHTTFRSTLSRPKVHRYHVITLSYRFLNCLGNEWTLNHINAVELSAFVEEKTIIYSGKTLMIRSSKSGSGSDLESLGVEAGTTKWQQSTNKHDDQFYFTQRMRIKMPVKSSHLKKMYTCVSSGEFTAEWNPWFPMHAMSRLSMMSHSKSHPSVLEIWSPTVDVTIYTLF